jgi:hypothetical protein
LFHGGILRWLKAGFADDDFADTGRSRGAWRRKFGGEPVYWGNSGSRRRFH